MKIPLVLAALIVMSASAFADTQATFTLPSGVNVKITEAPFENGRFNVAGCTEAGKDCLINGRIPRGVAFGLPKTYIKGISVSYQGRSFALEASDMYNAWDGRPLERKGVIRYFGGKCFDSKNCQFRGLFSDAAGSFAAEWRVVDGLTFRTVLSGSDDIVHLFMQDIDPPEFE